MCFITVVLKLLGRTLYIYICIYIHYKYKYVVMLSRSKKNCAMTILRVNDLLDDRSYPHPASGTV
jgi:hypothetical protein